MFNFLCTRALLKTVSNLSKLQSSNDPSFIARIVSLFDATKEGTIPRSILVRYSPDDERLRWFVRCWYTRRETTIHGRLNDEELGRSRLGVARIEEGGMKWKRFARSQTWIVPRLFLLAPLKIPILNATRNVRQPYSYSLSLNPRCIGNEKEVSHCWI